MAAKHTLRVESAPGRRRAFVLAAALALPIVTLAAPSTTSTSAAASRRSPMHSGGVMRFPSKRTPIVMPTSTKTLPAPTSSATSVPTVTSTPRPTSTPTAPPTVTATTQIALGARIADWGLDAPCDAAAIDNYASMVGRMPAVVMWYQTWGEYWNSWSNRCADNVRVRGAVPMITWEPWNGQNPDPAYKLTDIARGDFDPYIRKWATDAKNWGHTFYLRFAQEMNGNWYPWGTKAGNPEGNLPADYVAAWRHIHDIFSSVGVTNAVWLWSPNIGDVTDTPYASDYPGDAFVNQVGIDGYNYGSLEYPGWTSLQALFSSSYREMSSLTSKPLWIAETGTVEQGGNKASWMTQGFLTDIPTLFPRVRGVVWFDKSGGGMDLRVNSSAPALTAWTEVVASPLYQGSAP